MLLYINAMKTIRSLERLQQLHRLIEKERTGTPKELALKMNVSERLVYLLLEYLRDYNAEIRYDRGRRTYYYEEEFKLDIQISVAVINKDERTEIFGGNYI